MKPVTKIAQKRAQKNAIVPAPLSAEAKAFLDLYGSIIAVAVAIIARRLTSGKTATLTDAAEATAYLTPGMKLWRMKALLSAAAQLGALAGDGLVLRPGAGFMRFDRRDAAKAA